MSAETIPADARSGSPLSKAQLAARVAADIRPGSYVNLGIGLPTLVADHLPEDSGITLHTENGLLGMGPTPEPDAVDPELINAGKVPVTELAGASYFHQADSFAMMRGGHIDVCVLGAFQVSTSGDLANWSTGKPGAVPAVGGAMDLAVGAKRSVVMMTLLTKDGQPKLLRECTLPLTGVGCVSRIYSDIAVIDVGPGRRDDDGARVVETYGVTHGELEEMLGLRLGFAAG
ncbi:3-oxoadipate CoA-transferase beta subunit [Promicromonospora sp. AC04]|uniref:3-oxoacid CoA-transferase subunit B n=1 Tax=Promicromonospora sp. AC04 TaxID=2135723 RepID=UPI000D370EAB|nr:3-oxoacid CoA-transferase subunit B [Promicromonospora sp. AC04]PUB28585.1 3-oxoadipate CoA-transferase beta subunit [Promicromonospora sp. AC04]